MVEVLSSHAVLWDTVYCVVGWFVKTDNFVLRNQPTKKKSRLRGANSHTDIAIYRLYWPRGRLSGYNNEHVFLLIHWLPEFMLT